MSNTRRWVVVGLTAGLACVPFTPCAVAEVSVTPAKVAQPAVVQEPITDALTWTVTLGPKQARPVRVSFKITRGGAVLNGSSDEVRHRLESLSPGPKEITDNEFSMEAGPGVYVLRRSLAFRERGTVQGVLTVTEVGTDRELSKSLHAVTFQPQQQPVARILDVDPGEFETGDSPYVAFTVQEALQQELKTKRPTVVALKRHGAGAARVSAAFSVESVRDDQGTTIEELTLASRESKALCIFLKEIAGPGTFSGRLQLLPTNGAAPVDATFSFAIRHGWWIAALLLAAGAALVFILNVVAQKVIPRLARKEEALAGAQRYEELRLGLITPEERRVLARIQPDLHALRGLVGQGKQADFAKRNKVLLRKLELFPKWVNGSRLIRNIPRDASAEHRAKLNDLGDYFGIFEPSDTRTTAAAGTAGSIETTLIGAARKYYDGEIEKLRTEVTGIELPPRSAEATKARAGKAKEEALEQLGSAKDASDEADFSVAATHFDDARQQHVYLQGLQVHGRIDEKPVAAIPDGPWQELRAALLERITGIRNWPDADVAQVELRTIQRVYCVEMRSLLAPVAERLEDPHKKAVTDTLAKMTEHVKAGKFAEAIAQVDRAVVSSRAASALAAPAGEAAGLESVADEEPGAPSAAAFSAMACGDGTMQEPVDFEAARKAERKKRFWLEFALWAFSALIAVILGIVTLWLNDPDWGTASDMITALLWGLGVSAGSKAGLGGIEGLRTTLTGTKPAIDS